MSADLFHVEQPETAVEEKTTRPRFAPPDDGPECCGRCANAVPWTINAADTGFVTCKELPPWDHWHPAKPCFFKPVRFRLADGAPASVPPLPVQKAAFAPPEDL